MACVTACPSGVQYDSLLEAARPQVEREAKRGFGDRAFRQMIFAMFPHPGRLRAAVVAARCLSEASACSASLHSSGLLGAAAAAPAGDGAAAAADHIWQPRLCRRAFPRRGSSASGSRCCSDASSACSSATSTRRPRASLPPKAAKSSFRRRKRCCGALAEHAGEEEDAMAAARKTHRCVRRDQRRHHRHQRSGLRIGHEAIRPSAAQRSGLRRSKAQAFAAKCKDISEVLAELEPRAPRGAVQLKAAYHDACHLQHAQGVRAQPRPLLQAIPGVNVREIAESEICCGSAGIYNLLEPDAGDATPRSQSAEHPQDRRGGDRVGQSGMSAANRHRPRGRGPADAHHASRRSPRSVHP